METTSLPPLVVDLSGCKPNAETETECDPMLKISTPNGNSVPQFPVETDAAVTIKTELDE